MDDAADRTTSAVHTVVRADRTTHRRSDLEITGWHRDGARFLAGCIGTGAVLGAAVAAVRRPHD
jgi:hypothetical protein